MTAYRDSTTFREIDAQLGLRKGDSFRAFKRLGATLREGEDYTVLSADRDAAAIAQLRSAARIYASSINVVLLAPRAQALLLAELQGQADPESSR